MRQLSQSAFCVLLLTVLACVAAQSEELQWIKWDESGGGNGHEYAVLTAPASWTSQKALAEAEGGYLATVLSAEEQAFVMSVIGAAEASERATSDYYWFGLFQDSAAAEPDEGWQWVTGEALAFGIVDRWLDTPFDGDRHLRRITKFDTIENLRS